MHELFETGRHGEDQAADVLTAKGYRILARNWRAGSLEIDLIALDGDILVFVEVKTRKAPHLVDPGMAVTKRKQRSLIKAANIYVERTSKSNECRFDIITVVIGREGEKVEHIENAFYPGISRV